MSMLSRIIATELTPKGKIEMQQSWEALQSFFCYCYYGW